MATWMCRGSTRSRPAGSRSRPAPCRSNGSTRSCPASSARSQAGAQVYWVCPLVAESELLDLAAAEERYAALQATFGDRVGLVHGRLVRQGQGSRHGRLRLGRALDPGVDHGDRGRRRRAERLDHDHRACRAVRLAQLHQLRGRVGRGAAKSSCILLYRQPLSETARERLNVMRNTEDGFVIAEEDLRLRGGGEMLGTRQSGLPAFRIASLPEHQALLEAARDQARLTLARDPELTGDGCRGAETAALSVRARRRGQADARGLTPVSGN